MEFILKEKNKILRLMPTDISHYDIHNSKTSENQISALTNIYKQKYYEILCSFQQNFFKRGLKTLKNAKKKYKNCMCSVTTAG